MKQHFTLILLLHLIFFSCQTTTDEKPKGGDLSKNTWKLVEYSSSGDIYPMKGDRPITARFEKDRVTGSASCNRYFGKYAAQGVGLRFTEVATTKRVCPDELLNTEGRFLNLLKNAQNYTATLSKLTIFCTDGLMRFEASQEAAIQKNSYADFLMAFRPLVIENNHLYSVLDEKQMDNYPFVGKALNSLQLDYIDPQTVQQYKATQGKIYQVGTYKKHYLLRTPGKYASTDLTLFSLDKYHNRAQKEVLLTYAWCDENACNQQDAWLKDVNDDGKFDIVTKYVFTENGKVQSTTMSAFIQQSADGSFVQDDKIKLNATDYIMATK